MLFRSPERKEKAVPKTQPKPTTNKKKGRSGKLRDEDLIGKTVEDFTNEQLDGLTEDQWLILAPVETKFAWTFKFGEPMLPPEDLEKEGRNVMELHAKCMQLMDSKQKVLHMWYEHMHFLNGPGDNDIEMEDIFYLLNLQVIYLFVMRCFVLYVLQTQSNFSLDSLKREVTQFFSHRHLITESKDKNWKVGFFDPSQVAKTMIDFDFDAVKAYVMTAMLKQMDESEFFLLPHHCK